jgi:hypothetical protein
VSATLDAIRTLKGRFGTKINICTITPASLEIFFTNRNPDVAPPAILADEQVALETDILFLNSHIADLNAGLITNINLASRFKRKSKKKRQRTNKLSYRRVDKFTYSEIPDGVHFSERLKSICFALILNTAIRDIGPSTNPDPPHMLQPWQMRKDRTNHTVSDSEFDFLAEFSSPQDLLQID